MTRMRLGAFVIALFFSAALTGGEITVLYTPTSLDAGVATELTISVRDESGDGFGIGCIIFDFVVPPGLSIGDFVWLSGLDDTNDYISEGVLPDVAQTVLLGSTGAQVPPGGTLDIASLIVTASAGAAGTTQTLVSFPENSSSSTICDDVMFEEQIITAGREVGLSVAPGSGGDSGGGDGDSGDGGDSGTPDPPDVPDDDGEDEPIVEGEPDQDPADEEETGDIVDPDPDESDEDAVDDPTNDNGSSPEPTDEDDGDESPAAGDTGVAPTVQESGNTDTPSSGPRPGAGFCGLGLIGTGLFTLVSLSVMKFHRRRLSS